MKIKGQRNSKKELLNKFSNTEIRIYLDLWTEHENIQKTTHLSHRPIQNSAKHLRWSFLPE